MKHKRRDRNNARDIEEGMSPSYIPTKCRADVLSDFHGKKGVSETWIFLQFFWFTAFYIMPSYDWFWEGFSFHVLHIACAVFVAHASYCFMVHLPPNPAILKRVSLFLVFNFDWNCLTLPLPLTLTFYLGIAWR